jgi:predicted O-methyltransferase YrrM
MPKPPEVLSGPVRNRLRARALRNPIISEGVVLEHYWRCDAGTLADCPSRSEPAARSCDERLLLQWVEQESPPSGVETTAFLSDKLVAPFLSDKLVALDREKAEFCYQLCRANGARRIVEAGTSFGVSTLYLAAAVRDNTQVTSGGTDGVVIATEREPNKVRAAKAHFQEAGLSGFIDLREGDLRETLKLIDGPIDFMLVDIWMPMARPALELVSPHLRPGAIVICDNTARYRSEYAEYLAFLSDPTHGFLTMTLPFPGGLEFSVRSHA